MGRLYFRAVKTARTAQASAIDHVVLASVLTLTLCWVIYFLLVVTTASCVAAIGYLLGESRYAPPLLDMFTLAFCAAGALWFVNMVRVRQGRQSYWVRAFELILLSFGLLTVLTWNEYVRPQDPMSEVTESIRGGLGRTVFFRTEHYYVEEGISLIPPYSFGYDEQGRSFFEALEEDVYAPTRPDNAHFPLGLFKRPAADCPCLNRGDMWTNYKRLEFEWVLEYAELSPDQVRYVSNELEALPDFVERHEWCESALNLARYR